MIQLVEKEEKFVPIMSARVGGNADVFPDILKLYGKEGDSILDMTWGKGVFWKKVTGKYDVTANDQFSSDPGVDTRWDFRDLPESWLEVFDLVVFDPPYMPNSGTIGGNSTVRAVAEAYRNNDSTPLRNQKEVVRLYEGGIKEAHRVLKRRGVLVVKCKDMTGCGKEGWIHPWVMGLEGWRVEDLFVVVMPGNQLFDPKWKNQKHSRKNWSVFVVLRKL